jgi:hypothetical protein
VPAVLTVRGRRIPPQGSSLSLSCWLSELLSLLDTSSSVASHARSTSYLSDDKIDRPEALEARPPAAVRAHPPENQLPSQKAQTSRSTSAYEARTKPRETYKSRRAHGCFQAGTHVEICLQGRMHSEARPGLRKDKRSGSGHMVSGGTK